MSSMVRRAGDELPEQLRSREGRRVFLREARQRLETEDRGQQTVGHEESAPEPGSSCAPDDDAPPSNSNAAQDNEPEDTQPADPSPSKEPPDKDRQDSGPAYVFDTERIVARVQGREGWLREARRQLEEGVTLSV